MDSPILKLVSVNKKLSEFFSLKNICLDLYKGEVHALIGENGSGKSSLMNVIGGMYPPDSGAISINGYPVNISTPIDAKRNGISIIHQTSTLFEHFSIAENIYIDNKPYYNKALKIIDWNKMFTDCDSLFKKFGFTLNSKTIVANLNLAQKQLVEICKAYINSPSIIIMDEPTAALTENESDLFFNIIYELKKTGVAILYVSHKLEEVKKIGDRISVIRNGEIIGTRRMDNLNVDSIIHMMTGLEIGERYPKLRIKSGKEILKVSNLYSGNTLKDIGFSLYKQEILGIIGLVGSGRTKIAKCIFGLDKIDSGEIYINSSRVNISCPKDAISNGIGYVTEDRNTDGLFMYLNIPENITAPNISRVSNKYIIDKSIEKKLTSSFVDRLGMNIGTINNKAAYISGGNQQKVVLAKWIMSKSKILILDEPTKGIDIASKLDVYNVMNELVTKNVSIILISSDVDEVIGMCDRIMVLYDGKIAALLPRAAVTREKIIYYATGGKD